MSKIAVVYWSGTGNTEAMANEVAEGAKEKGAEVTTLTASEFSASDLAPMITTATRYIIIVAIIITCDINFLPFCFIYNFC